MKQSEIGNEIINRIFEENEKGSSLRAIKDKINKELNTNLTEYNVKKSLTNNFLMGTDTQKSLQYDIKEEDNQTELNIRTNKRIKTLEDLITQCSIDLDNYEVERHTVNKRDGHSKDNDGNTQITELFQVKARLKPRKSLNLKHAKEEIKNELKKYSPCREKIETFERKDGYLLEICPKDLHFNKFADKEISEDEYNTNIAEQRFENALSETMERAEKCNIDRVLLVLGSDMMHIDNKSNTTTGGTAQDVYQEYRKSIKRARQFLRTQIEKIFNTLQVPIDVVIVPGNHDYESSFHIGDSLECIFENDKNINIDNGLTARKYYQYGNNCVALTHGKDEKQSSLPLIVLQEMRKKGITAENVEIHRGHFHKKKQINYTGVDENTGITDRVVSSLSGTDEWHYGKGYVCNNKAMDSFFWSKDEGVKINLNCSGN